MGYFADDLFPQVIIIVFAIVLLLITLAIFGICFFKLRRDKKRAGRGKVPADNRIDVSPTGVQSIQQKPELDAQQTRHEMATEGRVFEMQGEDRCQELPGEETNTGNNAIEERLHELRGEEHAKELDSSRE